MRFCQSMVAQLKDCLILKLLPYSKESDREKSPFTSQEENQGITQSKTNSYDNGAERAFCLRSDYSTKGL